MKLARALVAASLLVLTAKHEDNAARIDQLEWRVGRQAERIEELEAVVWLERDTVGEECPICSEPFEFCAGHPWGSE